MKIDVNIEGLSEQTERLLAAVKLAEDARVRLEIATKDGDRCVESAKRVQVIGNGSPDNTQLVVYRVGKMKYEAHVAISAGDSPLTIGQNVLDAMRSVSGI